MASVGERRVSYDARGLAEPHAEAPRIAAAVSEPALPSMTTTPDIMFSHDDQPTRPLTWISGPSMSPQPK